MQRSEDDFDALMSAAGLLRCALEGHSLDEPEHDDQVAEGGVLLTSVIDFKQKTERLKLNGSQPKAAICGSALLSGRN